MPLFLIAWEQKLLTTAGNTTLLQSLPSVTFGATLLTLHCLSAFGTVQGGGNTEFTHVDNPSFNSGLFEQYKAAYQS